jgi:energy-coupling factor transporter ATP-binding protein EcfA2
MKRFPAGSEWRKWDLHVHAPASKMSNDQYRKKSDGSIDWAKFCSILHDSDVAAFGITDYFSLDSFFTFTDEYRKIYPDDHTKVFFPNIELRLPEALNRDGQSVNIHIIFRPDLTREDAEKFTYALKTISTGPSKQTITCHDLSTKDDCDSATVSIQAIQEALKTTFGQPTQLSALVVTSAKGDGIRVGGKGSIKRKKLLSDEIDKASDAFFAGPESKKYFLDRTRLEKDEEVAAKPIFDGSDAHDFKQLTDRLGRHITDGEMQFHTTWIKADLTYEGLCQTLVEPEDRVAIQSQKPDFKQPYQYISQIHFSSDDDPRVFPSTIEFNPNLNAIIGSRSSGKSALLAYVAHAVNEEDAIKQEMDATGFDKSAVGPAAGKTWAEVQNIHHEVEWGSAAAATGKVIYIPQNSLFSLSEHPEEVTKKIEPALFRQYPDLEMKYGQTKSSLDSVNDSIRSAVKQWFTLANDLSIVNQEIRDLGDKKAIETTRNDLSDKINEAKERSALTDTEINSLQVIQTKLRSENARIKELEEELPHFSAYTVDELEQTRILPNKVQVTINLKPDFSVFPDAFSKIVDTYRQDAEKKLKDKIESAIVAQERKLEAEHEQLTGEVKRILEENAPLLSKQTANTELASLSKKFESQGETLADIQKNEQRQKQIRNDQKRSIDTILDALSTRTKTLANFEADFNISPRQLSDEFIFGVETGIDPEYLAGITDPFSRSKPTHFIARKGDCLDVSKAQSQPEKFLQDILSEEQKLKSGHDKISSAHIILTCTPEIRFTAKLEKDIIGGFSRSTMTPGKQALFALTLILNESKEPWPLLIDQPEDDLDSRSIYDTIVPYLVKNKKERQIIMVSHDANLVIGADSEEVIVANREGNDRRNEHDQFFDYLTGSLEYSKPLDQNMPFVLDQCGIREHACKILDGGKEAFEKRRNKYNL